ncbi:uncharacterized protein MONBRDRAFT_23116 [Monosiga brevicollis MX1]|uniref:Glycosyl transferase family 1 domain-containing protein n=1 Tax=Monosiga brevicollis TaxID=81824 RepID=A9UR84_MONBE|nr:uncharacterized protein MONBRDRAFT_23116 [Monosiga brevicollis MX1]EDQ91879.1 predicted protein [Monosiga brevicollis MX1]|eukprot:XP_001743165.1 hypothetical protein [Monosiga brevicollis MX1]
MIIRHHHVTFTDGSCRLACHANNTYPIQARIIWNAPVHSWTGIASEAVDFLVPLAKRIPLLGLTGGYTAEFVHDLPKRDQAMLEALRQSYLDHHGARVQRTMRNLPEERITIFITQYDPATYHDDLQRTCPEFVETSARGWDILIEAFLREFSHDDNVALYIRSGRDKDRPERDVLELMRRVNPRSPPPITWIPPVATADYAALYKTANAFVLPTHAEGYGRPVLEAMAMGLPTIVTNWSGITEFTSASTAYLIPVHGLEKAFPREPQITGWDFEGRHQWASINVSDVQRLMREVYAQPHAARRTGLRAKAHTKFKPSYSGFSVNWQTLALPR